MTNQYLLTISAVNRRDMLRKSSSELLVRVPLLRRSSAGSPAALFPVLPASSNDANETNYDSRIARLCRTILLFLMTISCVTLAD